MAEGESPTPSADGFLQLIEAHGTRNPHISLVRHTTIKDGPRTFKRAAVLRVASREPGEPRYDKLSLEAYDYRVEGGFDFENPKYRWHCEKDEIQRLRVFLETYGEVSRPGRHAVVPVTGATAVDVETVVEFLLSHDVDASDIAKLIEGLLVHSDELCRLPQLGERDQRRMLAGALRAAHRSDALRQLRQLIQQEAPEREFQALLDENWWLLGGQYVRKIPKREWTDEENLDMLLETADGYFDIIEFKRSSEDLVTGHLGKLIVSAHVNRAVNQAARYISEIESTRDHLVRRYDLDLYKLKAKVIVGHIAEHDSERQSKREAIRTYNSHLHRIEVITYDELVRLGNHIVDADLGESGQAGSSNQDAD